MLGMAVRKYESAVCAPPLYHTERERASPAPPSRPFQLLYPSHTLHLHTPSIYYFSIVVSCEGERSLVDSILDARGHTRLTATLHDILTRANSITTPLNFGQENWHLVTIKPILDIASDVDDAAAATASRAAEIRHDVRVLCGGREGCQPSELPPLAFAGQT
jgi:hypothetical protein